MKKKLSLIALLVIFLISAFLISGCDFFERLLEDTNGTEETDNNPAIIEVAPLV
ncbi:MAG: hypothetical protein FWB83_11730 [Treponema sp.]|nr:hypothetical protein [Treponema sp.]